MTDTIHNSDDLLSHLISLQDSGNDSIPLSFLIGTKDHGSILIEPMITSLKSIDSVSINFKFDGNKTITLETSDKSVQFSFSLRF